MELGARLAAESDLDVVVALARAAIEELRPLRGGRIWAELEARIESERVQVEANAGAEVAAGRSQRAAEILSEFMDRSVDAAIARSRELLVELRSAA